PIRAKEMFTRYGVDGIMIGRATYGRPWIFAEVKHYLKTGELMKPLSTTEKVEIARLHFEHSLQVKGAKTGMLEMRRHFGSYFKGLPHFKDIRLKLLTTLNPDEVYSLLNLIAERYGDYVVDESINPSPWADKQD
ncbi:MAG: tRNA-dihydrouridine synthase, partial [Tenuifilum sp.]